TEPPLIPLASRTPAEFIQRRADGGSIQPASGVRSMGGRMPPQLPEHIDSQFVGAGRVLNDPDDHAGDAPVVGMKNGFEIEGIGGGVRRHGYVRSRVHITITTPNRDL